MKNTIFFSLILIGTILVFFQLNSKKPIETASLQKIVEEDLKLQAPTPAEDVKKTPTNPIEKRSSEFSKIIEKQKTPLSKIEKKSVEALIISIKQSLNSQHKPENLIENFRTAGLKPKLGKSFNKDSGKMLIVRTDQTIPGVRYIHAQYFEDENKEPFLQHLSFEVRASNESLAEVQKQIQSTLGLSKPKVRGDFIEWTLSEGYIIWAKKLTHEDILEMRYDPNNAYAKEDIGIIQVAVEQEIH